MIKAILLVISIVYLQGASSCSHVPPIDVTFYRGDSAEKAIISDKIQDKIYCDDVRVDNYSCLSYEDIQKIYHTLQQCKEWK